jgi:transcription antitermination factor NusG
MTNLGNAVPDKLFSGKEIIQINSQLNWFVFYTFPRAEKVVYRELVKMNYDVFLPMTKTMSLWKNRQKRWIDQVLFPNYIFVKTRQCELYNITKTSKVVKYIQCAGKPSVISLKEVEGIKKMLCLEQEISVETNFYQGDKVKVVCGPLIGHEGILLKQNGKTRFGIQIKEINQVVLIDIDTKLLEKA